MSRDPKREDGLFAIEPLASLPRRGARSYVMRIFVCVDFYSSRLPALGLTAWSYTRPSSWQREHRSLAEAINMANGKLREVEAAYQRKPYGSFERPYLQLDHDRVAAWLEGLAAELPAWIVEGLRA